MNEFEPTLDVDPAIARACSRFLAQVRGVASVEGMAVVLLDRDQATSRVVFFWETPDKQNRIRESAGDSGIAGAGVDLPSTYLALNGCEGTLGAVLIRVPSHPFRAGGLAARLITRSAVGLQPPAE